MIAFTVPAVPVAQPRHRIGVMNGKARAFGAKKTHPIHAFKATVRMAAAEVHSGEPCDGPLSLCIMVVLPRPQAMQWKRKPTPRVVHAKKPDVDNLTKGVMDALNGLLWRDDAQVCELIVRKYIAAGDEQPHVYVVVETLNHER